MTTRTGRNLRDEVGHPILDADGHSVEYEPLVLDYLAEVGGATAVEQFLADQQDIREREMDEWYRRSMRRPVPPWWILPATNTVDRATAMLPALFADRLEEIGIDHSIVYPTRALAYLSNPDRELRQMLCRAVNMMQADLFRPVTDRLTPVALIPARSPDEAVAEIDYAVGVLGMKAVVLPSHTLRRKSGGEGWPVWVDNLVVDSIYDYDPVWNKCMSMQVVPTFHSGSMWGSRSTPSNYVYNHIGHFAMGCEIICKSLIIGGVTRRFPDLTFAFLEGGAGWAVNLLCDLVSHWKKRGTAHIRQYDPTTVDIPVLQGLVQEYGTDRYVNQLDKLSSELAREGVLGPSQTLEDDVSIRCRREPLNDFDASDIEVLEDFIGRFVNPFYFGCEADDPMTALAFDPRFNPLERCLNAMLSSDIGHWDVSDISGILAEAFEMVDDGILTTEQFRAFSLDNAMKLYTDVNPHFFEGTTLEGAARASLAGR